MGSNPQGFIDVAAASEILGCSEARVQGLAKHGMMKHREVEGQLYVDGADVEALERLGFTDELPGAELIHRLRLLEAKTTRLESSINMLFDINKMSASRFSTMSLEQLVQLHVMIAHDLDDEEWPTERLLSYCEIFIRLSEEDVDRMNQVLEMKHSWEVFYRLLIKVAKFVATHPDLDTDIELQRVRELLTVGRSNLRSIAIFFVHVSGDHKPSRELLTELASNDLDMFDDLAKQLKNTSKRGHLKSV